jgi:hypothetical protein
VRALLVIPVIDYQLIIPLADTYPLLYSPVNIKAPVINPVRFDEEDMSPLTLPDALSPGSGMFLSYTGGDDYFGPVGDLSEDLCQAQLGCE